MAKPPGWTTACPDWEKRIVAGESLIPDRVLFPDEAAAARAVLEELLIVDAPGSPRFGDIARPWILEFADVLFGSYDSETGRRLIQEYLLLVAKKNTKSTTSAALMTTALIRNWRKSAEFLVLAPTIEIANNAFYPARDMILADDELRDMLHIQEHYRTITHLETRATLKVVAADNETVSGKKAVGILVDELWLFGKRANGENLLREATGGLASRPEGFVIYSSTQSDDPPAGIFRQKLHYARGVRDGRINDKCFLPVLYEFPEAMIRDGRCRVKENFYIPNPNLGASVDVPFLEREYDKAAEAGEESMQGFLAKHLNVEIGVALQSGMWAGAQYWAQAADDTLTFDDLLARSDVAVIGIDGGGLDDLLGLCVLGRCKQTRDWLAWGHAWAQQDVLRRRKEIVPRLRDFEKEGSLTICDDEDPTRDLREVADIVEQVRDTGLLPEKQGVGLDPNGIASIVDELASRSIEGEQVVGISQGYRLTGAVWGAERKLKDGTLWHAEQKLMDWAVGNAKAEQKGNAVVITKQTAGKAKIDPLIALFNAVMLMSRNPVAAGTKDYNVVFLGGVA